MKDPKCLSQAQKEKLFKLKSLGFDDTRAQQSLEATKWDVDAAANHLSFGAEGATREAIDVALKVEIENPQGPMVPSSASLSSHSAAATAVMSPPYSTVDKKHQAGHSFAQLIPDSAAPCGRNVGTRDKLNTAATAVRGPPSSPIDEKQAGHSFAQLVPDSVAPCGRNVGSLTEDYINHSEIAASELTHSELQGSELRNTLPRLYLQTPGAYRVTSRSVETPDEDLSDNISHEATEHEVPFPEVDVEEPTMLVSAELVSEQPIVTATSDTFLGHLKQNRKTQIIVALVAVLMIALVVILGITLTQDSSTGVPPGFFSQVQAFDGVTGQGEFGSSVRFSGDGNRLAVGAPGRTDSKLTRSSVQVYELNVTNQWAELGLPVEATANDAMDDQSTAELAIRAPLAIALSRNGETMAVGSPFHDILDQSKVNIGQVELFHFNSSSRSWIPLGDPIVGLNSGDLFGASVALSEDGAIVAIGAPGSSYNTGQVRVFQLNSGSWILRGTEMVGGEPESLFGSSVSLSEDGTMLAAGGSTLPFEDTAGIVVRSFSFFGDWTELGSGVVGRDNLQQTVYQAELSSDGSILVISNYYVYRAGVSPVDNSESNESLDVRAFKLSQDDVWEPLGLPLHENTPGEKSGYVVSLSEDGHMIAMGDPGTHGLGGGAGSGHAHIYQFNGKAWDQIGSDVEGMNAGDLFGFSVALSGDGRRLVAGSPFSRKNGFEHGRVEIFEYEV